MMTVTQKAAVKIALMKNEAEGEKHVRLNLDSVT